jgi:hypothetical protein
MLLFYFILWCKLVREAGCELLGVVCAFMKQRASKAEITVNLKSLVNQLEVPGQPSFPPIKISNLSKLFTTIELRKAEILMDFRAAATSLGIALFSAPDRCVIN